jgi:RHS repeat-associated protein
VGSLDYLPFGGPMRWSGQTDLPELFTGQRRDAQTGAYDFRARLYEPSLGRFLAPDEARQYASPYVYAGNDPLGRTDPDGRAAGRAVALLGAAGAAAIGAFVDFVVRPAFRGSWPHRLFTSIFTTERVKALKEWGEDVDERDRGRLTSAIRSFGELLYNFSHQELAAIKQRYPYAYAYHTPIILLTIYRAIRPEIYVDWEGPQKGNAARHFFWMGKAARYGGVELARGLGAAHEEGRPGAGRLGFFDGLADKINNALAWNYADARKDELRTIFNQLWKDRLLALNAEGTAIAEEGSTEEARAQAEAELIESYRRGLEHLKQVFPHDTPDFNDEEREYLRKHLGWAAGA